MHESPSIEEPRGMRRGMPKGVFGRLLAAALLLLVFLAALPVVLTPVYALRFVHPVSTLMIGDYLAMRPVIREWVPIEEVSPVLLYSIVMSEDGQFCRHDGIDWGEMRMVVKEALSGEETRGASTIPMQAVKNLFLWGGRSYVRKALEAPLALYFDFVLSKRRIIEIYVNIVEWDTGVYGIGAASQHFFGVSADRLSARQAALLAVTLPAPGARTPADPGQGLRRLASRVQRMAAQSGSYVDCVRPANS